MRPYSADLRARVVRAVEGGQSCRQAAKQFDVSASAAVKWVRRHRATGSCAARQMGPTTGSKLDAHARLLEKLVASRPDATLVDIQRALARRGVSASVNTIWRFFVRRRFKLRNGRRSPPNDAVKASPGRR